MEAANILLLHSAGMNPAAANFIGGADQSAYKPAGPGEGPSFEEVFYQKTGQAEAVSVEENPAGKQEPAAEKNTGTESFAAAENKEAEVPRNSERSEKNSRRDAEKNRDGKQDRAAEDSDGLRIENKKNKKEILSKDQAGRVLQGKDPVKGKTADASAAKEKMDAAFSLKNPTGKKSTAAAQGVEPDLMEDGILDTGEKLGVSSIVYEGSDKVTMTLNLEQGAHPGSGEETLTALQAKGSSGSGGRNSSAKTVESKKRFSLIDLRSGKDDTGSSKKAAGEGVKTASKAKAPASIEKLRQGGEKFSLQKNGLQNGESEGFDIVKEEVLEGSEKNIKLSSEALQRQPDRGPASQSMRQSNSAQLTRHLAEQGNRQIVKQTGIILKNNGSGEIKLVLKPESMGNVRIQLQLQDNAITGKILVDNSAVKTAFDQNMDDLYRAFKDAGFETAELNVQVGGEKSGEGSRERNNGAGLALHKIEMIEEQIPLIREENSADTLINLVV